jgi:hypothetical protein
VRKAKSQILILQKHDMEIPEHDPAMETGGRRYVPLLAWVLVVLTLVLIPLKIVSYGYVPVGDARRHVAKAFTDKPYDQIMVMRPGYTVDHSPGWEWSLHFLHRKAGWSRDQLMSFSVCVLTACVFFSPLLWLRRPEAWLAALLAQMVAVPELMERFAQGRPFLITEGVLIALLFYWRKPDSKNPPALKMILTSAVLAFSVFMHGSWYLWVLLPLAFFLAQQWRAGMGLSVCCVIGVIVGALLTGNPAGFLETHLTMAFSIYNEHAPQWVLVGELGPGSGDFTTLILLAVIFLWRRQDGKNDWNFFRQPVVWLLVVGWIFGLRADRFWSDWGLPAALVWMTIQFDESMQAAVNPNSLKRLMLCGLLATPLYFHCTDDFGRRYTSYLTEVQLDANDPQLQGWLPEKNGIFYAAQMSFFYDTFYRNPQADWRYAFGFEPALMTDENLKIYRRIQWNQWDLQSYEPWIKTMRPADRLVVLSSTQPDLPQLEWRYAFGNTWIGRLPENNQR